MKSVNLDKTNNLPIVQPFQKLTTKFKRLIVKVQQ